MSLNGFFDKIYCINLDKRPDRWDECVQEFKKHRMIVERFSAADHNHPIVPKQLDATTNNGNAGLVASNILILQDAIANGYKNILILEDDVAFVDDLNEKFAEWSKDVPENWDMLYLGGNNWA
ncbi:hypothetical protein EBU94_02015, partial [bacterium]|nr:hypothetical protein [bacterium]